MLHDASGRLDRRFGDHGKVRTDLGAVVGEGVRGLILQRDGRIVVAGDTQGPGGADVGLARYRPDGRLDLTFGSGGVVITSVSPATDEVGGLARGPARLQRRRASGSSCPATAPDPTPVVARLQDLAGRSCCTR